MIGFSFQFRLLPFAQPFEVFCSLSSSTLSSSGTAGAPYLRDVCRIPLPLSFCLFPPFLQNSSQPSRSSVLAASLSFFSSSKRREKKKTPAFILSLSLWSERRRCSRFSFCVLLGEDSGAFRFAFPFLFCLLRRWCVRTPRPAPPPRRSW